MMRSNIMVILLGFMLFSAVSTGIWAIMEKRAKRDIQRRQLVRMGIWFFGSFYFVVSALKYVIGDWENTLAESFWDMGRQTVIHYGLALMAAAVFLPVFVKLILREKSAKFVDLFNQCLFFSVFLLMLWNGKIRNRAFTWAYAACGIVALVLTILYKKELVFANGKDCRKKLLTFLPVIASWVIMNGIFLPNELYLTNMDEFTNSYGSFFLSLLAGALATGIVVMMLAAAVLTVKAFDFFRLLLFGIVLMNYLQYILLNGKLELLDGNEQEWAMITNIVNICLWIAVIVIVILLGTKKPGIVKLYNGICAYICLIQIVTLGFMCFTSELEMDSHRAGITNYNALNLSSGNNIVVFVLDNFDNQWFQELRDEDEAFTAPLNDFCFYDNVTSQFAHTSTAIPFLLTGVEWSEENEDKYARIAYEQSNYLKEIQESNFDVGVYTHGGYLADKEYVYLSNYGQEIERKTNTLKTISVMWKCSMYKTLPFMAKSSYMYYTDEINDMVEVQGKWDIDNDIPFYESLVGTGLSVSGTFENAFRFYHMRGAHSPYYMSEDIKYDKAGREVSREDQERGCLKIVYEYLEQLKALGLYDAATIIITADHGRGVAYDQEQNMPEMPSMPILLVKEAFQKSDSMQTNHAPVTQKEILPTVIRAIGKDYSAYGVCVDEIPLDYERQRTYVSIYKNYIIRYAINGDANDIQNWSTIRADFYE